jgi:predicted Rossmann fold nucleotide-binding protein DprA/Smf involved in DNA uptake
MRAFVVMRQLLSNPPIDTLAELQHEVKKLKSYIEDCFTDYNDINEDTRMQLELISQSLAELQAHKRIAERPRRRIGFNVNNDENA